MIIHMGLFISQIGLSFNNNLLICTPGGITHKAQE